MSPGLKTGNVDGPIIFNRHLILYKSVYFWKVALFEKLWSHLVFLCIIGYDGFHKLQSYYSRISGLGRMIIVPAVSRERCVFYVDRMWTSTTGRRPAHVDACGQGEGSKPW